MTAPWRNIVRNPNKTTKAKARRLPAKSKRLKPTATRRKRFVQREPNPDVANAAEAADEPIVENDNRAREHAAGVASSVGHNQELAAMSATAPEISGFRKKSLAELIRDSLPDQQIIKRASREALKAWFRQSERLAIARTDHDLRGENFMEFADRIGVDKSSAYLLVHLCRFRPEITSRCRELAKQAEKRGEVFRYPGWETALGWFYKGPKSARHGNYILLPPALYAELDKEFHFDFDPFPNPRPDGYNSLVAPWGRMNLVNAPFRKDDVYGAPSATDCVLKAITEQQNGKTSVMVLPAYAFLDPLLRAGAEIRPLGRVPFIDPDTKRAQPNPMYCILCVVRPKVPRTVLRDDDDPDEPNEAK
jgi:hypothetical protein